jgi:hypothetical protein
MTERVSRMGRVPIELTVMPDPADNWAFQVCWSDGRQHIGGIPETWLDLIPFMAARTLLSHGYEADRLLIVRLQGADYELMSTTLGAAAGTPLPNEASPARHPMRCIYRKGDAERERQRLRSRDRFFRRRGWTP